MHSIIPPEQCVVRGGEGGGKSDETSRICCDHVNFSEMNGRDKFIRREGGGRRWRGTKLNNHKEGS